MLDSRDNSVLKSLKELRKQEEDRIKKERAEAEARAEAERRAKEDAERKVKEEAVRAKREEEERVRRIEEEKEAREREERLRLQEAERRAHIEAATQLQQERMRLEAHAKTAAKANGAPIRVIVGIVAAVLVIAGGIIYKISADHAKQTAVQQAQHEKMTREAEAARLRLVEEERRFAQLEANFKKQLAEAKSDTERNAIQKQLDDARARSNASSGGSKSSAPKDSKKETSGAAPTPTPAPALIKTKKTISDDPLEGLKL